MVVTIAGAVLVLLAGAGALYMLAAAALLHRFFARAASVPSRGEAVTVLKPLHGLEPQLGANLAGFLDQRHDGAIQLVCGVQRPDDPAIGVVEALQAGHPAADIALVLDPARHGASGKISNLVNMDGRAAHDVLILSDSDIAVAPDYLARVLAALDTPGVGAVTCFYRGRGDTGIWSWIAAAGLDWQFLPGAVFGVELGIAHPCMGSTIALRRETLEAIGGFARFAEVLADDHAIGAAVEALGLRVAVPPMLVTHGSTECSFGEVWRHELRWARTVRGVVPSVTYMASIVGYPLPIALAAIAFVPVPGLIATGIALAARLAIAFVVGRVAGARPLPLMLLPLRDVLGFAIFIASFFARSVDWRGATFKLEHDGRTMAAAEIPPK